MKEKEQFILEYGRNNNISNHGNDYCDYKEVIADLISIIGDDECKDDIYNVDYWYNYIKNVVESEENK